MLLRLAARKVFRRRQRIVQRAVDRAREEWITRVAREGEAAVKDGGSPLESYRRCMLAVDQPGQLR